MRLLVTGGSGFIGTNLVSAAVEAGDEVRNLDRTPPLDTRQHPFWRRCDILDAGGLAEALAEFAPSHVLHLAARTDTETDDPLEAYPANTTGTANLLAAVRATPSVEHLVVTSTQFVHRPGRLPEHDRDYDPHTVYGQSKVVTEQLTRDADLACGWTLIRPTTVWGPWCLRYTEGFFPALRRGLYLHPGRAPCRRSYGYVGNVVHQIRRIFELERRAVDRRTFYVGDEPIVLLDWVNAFAEELTGRPARVAPRPLVRGVAWLGDAFQALTGRPAPLQSARLRSMVEDYDTPMKATFDVLGEPPVGLREGVRATLRWLHEWERNRERGR